MKFKDELSQASYYKTLGDKAFAQQKFQQAADNYLKGLSAYPFLSVQRNAKASLKQIANSELSELLKNLEEHKQRFLQEKTSQLLDKLDHVQISELKSDFFKYPFSKYPEIVAKIQLELGRRFMMSPNSNSESFFIYLGKYNPGDQRLQTFILTVVDRLRNYQYVENAIADFAELVKYYGDIIEEKLPIIAEQLTTFLSSSIAFNERRYSAYALEFLGRRNFDLIKPALPILYENIRNPKSILEGLRNDVDAISTPLYEVRVSVEVPNPHLWVSHASIDTIGNLATEHPLELEHFVPIIIEQLISEDSYIKRSAAQALINFRSAGVDITKYFPRQKIETITKLLESPTKE